MAYGNEERAEKFAQRIAQTEDPEERITHIINFGNARYQEGVNDTIRRREEDREELNKELDDFISKGVK